MAVPRMHHTRGRRNKRRLHIYLKPTVLTVCKKCAKPVMPHIVCDNCGYYKGREVIDVMKKLTKKERKQKAKEIAAKEEGASKAKPLTMEELSRQ